MSELRDLDRRVRQQLRYYGVRLPRAKPEVSKVKRRWNPLDYICSYYDGQDGRPVISIKAGGCDWLVRHEYGHFLIDYFGLDELEIYDEFFGGGWEGWEYEVLVPVARTADTLLRKKLGVNPPREFPTFYALLGGEEDFCECLAMLLDNRGDPTKANGKEAHEGLEKKLRRVLRLLRCNCRRPARRA